MIESWKEAVCDRCYISRIRYPSPNPDMKRVRDFMKEQGWTKHKKWDICPACTQRQVSAADQTDEPTQEL